ncbi:MAG: tRNA (adenosine(37)-N6)-dimethylallyltransferase MiaA [Paludibacteraceae bacterium]|nr:tRNA (adenosine(37)-N6)-dimethylallyltransferase MiaA [Paludibacteraceae bacterium]
MEYNLITIVGPTATGKTAFAARLAAEFDTEIISADSRQVYRDMTIGTGKDLADYVVNGKQVPYHLVDIVEAGYQYNVYEFQRDFLKAFEAISSKGKLPVLCGGTGLYVEAALKGYKMVEVPSNDALRAELANKSLDELTEILKTYKTLHNTSDTETTRRAIRAIEIAEYYRTHTVAETDYPAIRSLVVGIDITREERRRRISERLRKRLDEGMIDEVQNLLQKGLSPESLIYYGLEYKFVTNYLLGKLTYDELYAQLEIAIHQFAKRQMTWWRGMERRGTKIHWIDATLPNEKKIECVKELLRL